MANKRQSGLYLGELIERAIKRITAIRAEQPRRGSHGQDKKYSINYIAAHIGSHHQTVTEWLGNRRNRIPIHKLDQVLALLNIDILDLIDSGEVAECYDRGDVFFRHRVRANFKRGTKVNEKSLDIGD